MSEENVKITEVSNLGIPRNLARRALEISNWDVNNAVNSYYEGLVSNTQPTSMNNIRERNDNYYSTHLGNFFYTDPKHPTLEEVVEEFPENLEIKRIPIIPPVKIQVMCKKSPKILPIPSTEEEFRERFIEYDEEKEDRQTEFLKRTLVGFLKARDSYFRAVSQIFFITMNPYKKIEELVSDYDVTLQKTHLRKIFICVRKIAECDYFLGLFNEGMNCCLTNVAIFDLLEECSVSKKIMKLTYGVMGRIMMAKGNLEKAKSYIEKGLELDPLSGNLQRDKGELIKLIKGEEFENLRFDFLKNANRKKIKTYHIEFPIGDRYREVEFVDDLLDERVTYSRDEEVMKSQNLSELMIVCKVRNEEIALLWKSLMCLD